MSKKIIIIGSGPGGYYAAVMAAKKGLDVTVIEKGDIGGVCTNRGCIPSKALLSIAEKIDEIKGAKRDGITADIKDVDFSRVMGKKERAIKMSRKGIEQLLKENDVEVIEDVASLVDSKTVKLSNGEIIEGDHVIVATGSKPISLPNIQIDEENILSSNGALNLEEVPDSLLIIGGGYIGLEMAFIYSSLGSKVTIVELLSSLIPNMDTDLQDVAEQMMKRKRVKVYTKSKVTELEQDGTITAKIEGETEKEIEVDKVLLSVGRRPTPPETDLDIIGDNNQIVTDDNMKTKFDNLYSIGDVTGKSMLAHSAFKHAEIVVNDILGNEPEGFSKYDVPAGIYTHPELASVGMTEEEAKDNYDDVKIGDFPISATGRGSSTGQRMGLAKVITKNDGELIGVHLACPGATDIIMEAAVGMHNKLTADELADIIHPHPTYSEAIKDAAENSFGESIHSH
ncbi:MAG: dihydrolipoyl dehydrogenase [Thermoplasmata archaeon]